MKDNEIINFCCEAHNNAYIDAREKARLNDDAWTDEVHRFLDAIKDHSAQLHTVPCDLEKILD